MTGEALPPPVRSSPSYPPLRTAAAGRTKRSGSDAQNALHASPVVRAVSAQALPFRATWEWVFIEAQREGRGSRGLKWDKPSMERLGECESWGCAMHIAALSLSARLYLGNKIAWVWTLQTEVIHRCVHCLD